MTGIAKEERAGKRTPQWIHDFKLADFGDQGLFYEYLEMSEWLCEFIFLFWGDSHATSNLNLAWREERQFESPIPIYAKRIQMVTYSFL